jgi:uncharacterized protein YybS (DUF2232 family)
MNRKAAIGMLRAAALAAAFFLAGGAIPFVGALVMIFSPAPVLGYAIGRPLPHLRTLGSIAAATGLVAAAAGLMASFSYLLSFGLATAIVCYMIEKQYRFEMIILAAATAMVVAGTIGSLIVTGSPEALAKEIHDTLANAMGRSADFYKLLGADTKMASDTQKTLLDMTIRLVPAIIVLASASTILLNLIVVWRWLGSKERFKYPLFSDLVRWNAPEWLIWVLITAGFALFVPVAGVKTLAIDSFVCVAAVYFCQGLAIVAYYFRALSMPMAVRTVVYVIAMLQPIFAGLLCAVGVFDIWIDFRRLKPPSEKQSIFGDFF